MYTETQKKTWTADPAQLPYVSAKAGVETRALKNASGVGPSLKDEHKNPILNARKASLW